MPEPCLFTFLIAFVDLIINQKISNLAFNNSDRVDPKTF